MKKLTLNLEGFKQPLTKEQMKRFIGGDDGPDAPTATGSSGQTGGGSPASGGGGYKCCWSGTSTCSKCVPEATSAWHCVSGASLTAC